MIEKHLGIEKHPGFGCSLPPEDQIDMVEEKIINMMGCNVKYIMGVRLKDGTEIKYRYDGMPGCMVRSVVSRWVKK